MPKSEASVLFVVGPTAVGKSALALHLALAFNGEIVNADSRQVYRLMDIGTAKPSPGDRERVRHHLIDILDPDQDFNLAVFLRMAREAIQGIRNRGKLPIVAGGTGQYIWALLEGWQVPHVPPHAGIRRELEDEAGRDGAGVLHQRLHEVDPQTASTIDPRNLRRVIRALEIYLTVGAAPSSLRRKHAPPSHRSFVIGLTLDRKALYGKIDRRVDDMLRRGLVEEVQDLLRAGYSPGLPCMASMGYREAALYLNGELTLEEAAQRIKYETHRFARRQYAWFRPADPRIHWVEAGLDVDRRAGDLAEKFLSEASDCGKIASANGEIIVE